jgi:hypothetical protein
VAETGPRLANITEEARLTIALHIFFPKFENNFEAGFSRVTVQGLWRFCLAIAAGEIGKNRTLALGKSHLKPFTITLREENLQV